MRRVAHGLRNGGRWGMVLGLRRRGQTRSSKAFRHLCPVSAILAECGEVVVSRSPR